MQTEEKLETLAIKEKIAQLANDLALQPEEQSALENLNASIHNHDDDDAL